MESRRRQIRRHPWRDAMTRLLFAALIVLSITTPLSAQNSLRPGTLPDVDAQPIESANQRPAAAKPAKKVSKTKSADSADEARLLLHEAAELSQAGTSIEP